MNAAEFPAILTLKDAREHQLVAPESGTVYQLVRLKLSSVHRFPLSVHLRDTPGGPVLNTWRLGQLQNHEAIRATWPNADDLDGLPTLPSDLQSPYWSLQAEATDHCVIVHATLLAVHGSKDRSTPTLLERGVVRTNS
jgi:hypothetical protein